MGLSRFPEQVDGWHLISTTNFDTHMYNYRSTQGGGEELALMDVQDSKQLSWESHGPMWSLAIHCALWCIPLCSLIGNLEMRKDPGLVSYAAENFGWKVIVFLTLPRYNQLPMWAHFCMYLKVNLLSSLWMKNRPYLIWFCFFFLLP